MAEGRPVEVLSVSSDTKILRFLNLQSEEKVFIDSDAHTPVMVERDVVFFGKRELIQEIYDQKQGCVKIIRGEGDQRTEEFLYTEAPIHNILALLYFFPKDLDPL